MTRSLRALVAGVVLAGAGCTPARVPMTPPASDACVPVGQWVSPATRRVLDPSAVLRHAASAGIVLLGEYHDRADHHRWQLQTLAALAGLRPGPTIGFEMFPRRVQPALDRWVAGELTVDAFLRDAHWDEVWGFDPQLYLPLFHAARLSRLPMAAINVDRALVSRVGRQGWAAVPAGEREGIGDPAPPSPAYRAMLQETFAGHGHGDGDAERFVEAQLTWDRALAEGLMAAARARPRALVVGIMGSGHLEDGYGVPHQLHALGADDVVVLLPWDTARDCSALTPGLADAVFGIGPPVDARPPRLGVRLGPATDGIRIVEVEPGGVAAAAGLRVDDVVLAAAGTPVATATALRAIVERQAPGAWLPLRIRRDDREREVVARFPGAS